MMPKLLAGLTSASASSTKKLVVDGLNGSVAVLIVVHEITDEQRSLLILGDQREVDRAGYCKVVATGIVLLQEFGVRDCGVKERLDE